MSQRGLGSVLSSGLTGNISAQSLALLVQLVVALVTIPVFANLWGVEDFGVWLILFTLPAYIALADFGFVGAAANAVTAAWARGDTNQAKAMYREVTGASFMLAALALGLAGLISSARSSELFAFAQEAANGFAGLIVFTLAAYAFLALCSRAIGIALRASGHFAKSAYCIALTALLDALLAVTFAAMGGGLAGAALGYALGQAVGLLAMIILARHHAPDFIPSVFTSSFARLKTLAGPALALVMIAMGQATLLQGTVIILGIASGAATVPAFVAMRTLARLGVQSVAVINQAVMPELTMARARSDAGRSADLVALNLAVALIVVVPGSVLLGAFGPKIVELWSAGAIEANASLAIAMAGVLVTGGLSGAYASFLTAVNEQGRFAPVVLIAAIAGLLLAFPLARSVGATGAALAVLAVELVVLWWAFRQARKASFLDFKSLRSAPSRILTLLRRS